MNLRLDLVAKAIKRSFELHEESWDPDKEVYKMDMTLACNRACTQCGLPEIFGSLLYLAVDSWPNDADTWADQILVDVD